MSTSCVVVRAEFQRITGVTQRLMVGTSSGHEELDQAALRVASSIEFTPALNQDDPVDVWIVLPITFTTR